MYTVDKIVGKGKVYSQNVSPKKEPHSKKWLKNELYECSSVVGYG